MGYITGLKPAPSGLAATSPIYDAKQLEIPEFEPSYMGEGREGRFWVIKSKK